MLVEVEGRLAAGAVRAGCAGPPATIGVYAFRDGKGELLYVGVSRNLARRVTSYFAAGHAPAAKAARIARLAEHVEWRTRPSVLEALVEEARTIRRERPHFNRRLKQTGGWVYARLDLRDPYPRFVLTRRLEVGPWRHLGPFPGRRLRPVVDLLADALGLRTCRGAIVPDRDARACLRYDLGQCGAPCVGAITPGAYGRQVARALLALGGGHPDVARDLGARGRDVRLPDPGALGGVLRALDRARVATRVIAVLPAVGGPGHRLLALAGGRLRLAVPAPTPATLRPAFTAITRSLVAAPPLEVAVDEVDEVRLVTRWLVSPEGRRATVDLERLGAHRAWTAVRARTVAGPLFVPAGG